MSNRSLPTLVLGVAASLAFAAPVLAHPNPSPVVDAETDAAHGVAEGHGHHLKLDGKLGPLTEAAVRRFQKAHGIKEDGIIGTETRKMLGMPAGPALRPGMTKVANEEIRTAQRLISHHEHIWHEAAAKPAAKPAAVKPAPVKPAPAAAAPKPAAPTPEPWSAAPSVTPSAEPWTPAPAPAPAAAAADRPFLTVYGGNMFLPRFSSSYDFDWQMTKPAYMAGLALWADDYGIAGDYTNLPPFFVGANQVLAGGTMIDAQVKWRSASDTHQLGLGYRGVSGNNLGAVSYGLNLPLAGDWLSLRGSALGATTFGPGWMGDGRLGLGAGFGAVMVDAGWRVIGLSGFAGTTSLVWTQAPFATVGLRF